MKATDIIRELQVLIAQHGDLEVKARVYVHSSEGGSEHELPVDRLSMPADSSACRIVIDVGDVQ